uniref:Serine aminopeptidase S33 domain-containing protein n=1 Tax=Chenopodium quinoa TaxID=63459 RepID=A0A803LFM4_CHEQI
MKLFTQWWTPLHGEKLGLICVVHGYTGESSWTVQLTSIHFAKAGFIVCAIDHQGHGYSDALDGYVAHIPDIGPVVDDCISFFDAFRERHAPGLKAFMYAESLGGAIALLITLRKKRVGKSGGGFDGQKFKPPWPLEHLLGLAATVLPTWRVVPTRGSIPDVSFKVEWKRKLAIASPKRYMGKPRAATAYELMRICREVQGRFEEVDIPLLIIHGGDDVVCDPACVEEFHQRASSKDKTLKIYPGMWHQLVGEPEENVELVFGDALDWLKSRALGSK